MVDVDAPYVAAGWLETVHEQAHENVQTWGEQDIETLLLAMQEELGELTQAYLEYRSGETDEFRVPEELIDLTALCVNLHWRNIGAAVADTEVMADGSGGRRLPQDSSINIEEIPAADGDAATASLIKDTAALVDGDRDTHGDAVDQQASCAEAWKWYLEAHDKLAPDAELTGSDVARMMILLKISRGASGEYDLDHDRDCVGYAGIAGACAVREGAADESELTRGGEDDDS